MTNTSSRGPSCNTPEQLTMARRVFSLEAVAWSCISGGSGPAKVAAQPLHRGNDRDAWRDIAAGPMTPWPWAAARTTALPIRTEAPGMGTRIRGSPLGGAGWVLSLDRSSPTLDESSTSCA